MDQLTAHNAQMVVHIAENEGCTVLIKSHLQDCELQLHKALANNAWLHQQLALLNSEVQVQLTSAATDFVSGCAKAVQSLCACCQVLQ